MRNLACHNEECANHGAAYFDFEPDETLVLCPVCGTTMAVTTLEAIAERNAANVAAAEAAEKKADKAAAKAAAKAPIVVDPVVERLTALGDQPVTASDLLAILRPEPLTTEDLDAHTADLGLQEETKPDA